MAEIFISYSRHDREFAEALYQELRKFNVRGFMDQADIEAGAEWGPQLRDAIRNADALVVVLSEAAAESSFVMAEIGMAQGLKKRIVPVLAPGERYDVAVPPELLDRLVMDASGVPNEEIAARIVAAVTDTSVEDAMQEIHSRNRKRELRRRFVLVSLLTFVFSLFASTYYALLERNAALEAKNQAIAAQKRLSELTGQGAIAFAPGENVAALGNPGGGVILLNTSSGETVGKLATEAGIVTGLAYSPDGSRLAVSTDNVIQIWDPVADELVAQFQGHTDIVLGIQFSPDGSRLISRSLDGTVRVWNPITGTLVESVQSPK